MIETRRNDRVVKVERRTKLGSAWRWDPALRNSKDSSQLNTSFVERLNLTIRQGSAGEGMPEEDFHLSDQMRFQAHDSRFRRNHGL